MLYKIKKYTDAELERFYEESMSDLDDFFGLGWIYNRPMINIFPDRKTLDSLMGRETENWAVGFVKNSNVYLLEFDKLGSESATPYSEAEYRALLKHELTHCFTNAFSKYKEKPIWLNEGISIFLSGQLDFKKKPETFKEFLGFYENGGSGVYSESGFVIEALVSIFGKEKILGLLRNPKLSKDKEIFDVLFHEIYGFYPIYEEFNKILA